MTHLSPAIQGELAHTVRDLAERFAASAVERDATGGTPKRERDLLRESGLLALSIPREFGGLGATWTETLDSVRSFARVDASIAHVYGFQHLLLATLRLFGRPAQWQPLFERTARENWFWGNALNPLDPRASAQEHGEYWLFNGSKRFCSGSVDAEMLVVSGRHGEHGKLLIAAIPSQREGVRIGDDWDAIGQRQTDSGSVAFENVRVEWNELLLDPGPLSTPYASLRPLLAQLIFVHLFLGIAEGAFDEARELTLTEARPWFRSNAPRAGDDPHIVARYGELWLGLESVRALTARASQRFEEAWLVGDALDDRKRGEAALAIAAAKVAATRVGLEVCSRIFDVAGARATRGALRLDRYWRNLRTQSLHDPVDYKIEELGAWALHHAAPAPSFYS